MFKIEIELNEEKAGGKIKFFQERTMRAIGQVEVIEKTFVNTNGNYDAFLREVISTIRGYFGV